MAYYRDADGIEQLAVFANLQNSYPQLIISPLQVKTGRDYSITYGSVAGLDEIPAEYANQVPSRVMHQMDTAPLYDIFRPYNGDSVLEKFSDPAQIKYNGFWTAKNLDITALNAGVEDAKFKLDFTSDPGDWCIMSISNSMSSVKEPRSSGLQYGVIQMWSPRANFIYVGRVWNYKIIRWTRLIGANDTLYLDDKIKALETRVTTLESKVK